MKFSSAIVALTSLGSCAAFTPVQPNARASTSLTALLDQTTGQAQLDPAVAAKYESLPFPDDLIMAEYVWVDAVGNTRSKTRTLDASKVRQMLYSSAEVWKL